MDKNLENDINISLRTFMICNDSFYWYGVHYNKQGELTIHRIMEHAEVSVCDTYESDKKQEKYRKDKMIEH